MRRAREVLAVARKVVRQEVPLRVGLWPRATVLLARQALELSLDELWSARSNRVSSCSMRAQLLCLAEFLPREAVASATTAWGLLSEACHYRDYELLPTSAELEYTLHLVEQVEEAVATVTGR